MERTASIDATVAPIARHLVRSPPASPRRDGRSPSVGTRTPAARTGSRPVTRAADTTVRDGQPCARNLKATCRRRLRPSPRTPRPVATVRSVRGRHGAPPRRGAAGEGASGTLPHRQCASRRSASASGDRRRRLAPP